MSEEKNQNEIEEVTNEDEHKDVEHYCYLCRRPESAAGNDWPAGRTARVLLYRMAPFANPR